MEQQQNEQSNPQKVKADADVITETLSGALDALLVDHHFSLGDVLGGVEVLALQIREQILVQYRYNMGDRLNMAIQAAAAQQQQAPADDPQGALRLG